MKITDLSIDGFGVWRDLSMDHLSDGVTVVYGENEAGKTTLMHFVRTVLYGFSPQRRERYFPPVHGGQAGGRLSIALPHGRYEVRRHLNGSRSEVGDVEITSTDGSYQSCHQLPTLLGGIDETIFNNVFAVGLREIQQLATLNDTQAAQHLYDLTTGLDRVSLFEVMRDLAASQRQILADDERPSELTQLLAQRQKLEEELRLLRNRTGEWVQLAAQVRTANDEIAHIEQRSAALERETRLVEVACNVRGHWQQRAEIDARLAGLGAVSEVPVEELVALQDLSLQVSQRRNRVQEIKLRRNTLRQQAEAVDVNDKLWRQRARIEALEEQQPWVASLHDQVARLEQELLELDDELTSEYRQFGVTKGRSLGASLPRFTDATLAELREPARQIRERKQRVEDARQEAQACEEEARQLQEKIEAELAACGARSLSEAMEQCGQQVSHYRRQTQVDDRLQRLQRHRDELQDQGQMLMDRQVLPLRALTGLGVLFVLGMVLLLTAIFSPVFAITSSNAWALALLGGAALIASAALKFGLEKVATRRLDDCYRQAELIQMQIDKVIGEQGGVDDRHRRGGGPITSRLQTAEQDLARLEELVPLESRREMAFQEAEAAQQRLAQADEAYRVARDRWRDTLRSLGLPDTLSPKEIKEFAGGFRQLNEKHQRLEGRREELEQRQAELAAVASRTAHLLSESGLHPKTPELNRRIEQLADELQRQQQLVARREEFVSEYRELRREYLEHSRAGRKLAHQQREMLSRIGVDDEQELLELIEKLRQVRELRETRDELSTRIAASLGVVCDEDDLAPHVDGATQSQLEKRLESLLTQFDAAGDQLKGLYERRGRLTEQLDSLAQDRRLAAAQLELGCVEQKIEQAVRQWQALGTIRLILEEIRTLYESDRQPETLRQATGYLTQLTRGRYTRVWTPLGDNILKVDDGGGRSYPVELLSRGTREQVYLSLRLALAAAYARRGIILPLVLDDVLVNFDTPRAEAAARVLRDFAEAGHQIIVFTCHEHIMRIFNELGMEVRELPAHGHGGNVIGIQSPPKPKRSKKIAPPPPPVVEEEEVEEELFEEEIEEIVAEEAEEEIEEEELDLADDDLEEPEEEFQFSNEEMELPDDDEDEEEELLDLDDEVEQEEQQEEEIGEEVLAEPDEQPEAEDDEEEYTASGETQWVEDPLEDEAYHYIDDDEAARRIALHAATDWEEDGQPDSEENNQGDDAEAA